MPEKIDANPLGTEKISRLIVQFSVPSVIALVVVAVYNIVDQIFIGRSVGYLGNAATNIILPFTTTVVAFGNMFSDGTASNMSLQLGSGREKTASHSVCNCVVCTLIAGFAALAVFEIFLQPFCRLFGATESTLPYALSYGRIIVLGFPLSMIDCALTGVIRADGRPRQSMMGMVIGCGTNVVLDWIFCLVLGWGVKGAALATIIGQGLNAVYYIFLLFRFRTVHPKKEYFRLNSGIVKKIMSLGLPSFITQISIVLVILVVNNIIVMCGAASKYGPDIPLAVMGITMKLCTVATSIGLGIASGTQPVWGYNYGNRQYHRVKSAFWIALISSTVIMVIAFLIFELFPEQLISLFGTESDLYMEFAVKCVRHYLAGTFMIGVGMIACVFFQALGRPVQSTVVSLTRQILILIPITLIFGYTVGLEGVIWGGAISDAGAGVVALIMIITNWKKLFPSEKKTE